MKSIVELVELSEYNLKLSEIEAKKARDLTKEAENTMKVCELYMSLSKGYLHDAETLYGLSEKDILALRKLAAE